MLLFALAIRLLAFNDFHGHLSPGTVSGRPAGGAAVLASYLRSAAEEAKGNALILYAGDLVGASPPNSALLQDEPSVSFLNLLANAHCKGAQSEPGCNIVGTPGNHEFDEGIGELQRLMSGGNHPAGPFLENPWRGARYPFVSANVRWASTHKTVFPPFFIAEVGGERIAVVGAVLRETPTMVTPSGVAGLEFVDEADSINALVPQIRALGVRAIAVILHQGGRGQPYVGPTEPARSVAGAEINEIVRRLDDEIDVVVSGHSHQFSNALVANAHGKQMVVTQAFSAGTAFASIDLQIDPQTHDVTAKTARIVSTFADAGPGLTPAADVSALVAAADARVAPLVQRVVGTADGPILKADNAAGESALGNLIADAQRAAGHGEVALMNPGGIRADIAAGPIRWGELFTVQPFGNDLVTMSLTGAQLLALLEQQWQVVPTRILKPSGLAYVWDDSLPKGQRVVSAQIGGKPLDPARKYRVTVNSFLAVGGDGFTTLLQGTDRQGAGSDLDALVAFIQSRPNHRISSTLDGRIRRK